MDLIPNGTPASLDGWTPFPSTWTYASATTFTVAGDVTATFGVGAKLKWTQSSTAYYGYVASSSYSSPNTTVTVAGNAVLNATISSPYYSYESNPQGFPHWFTYVPTIGGVSSQPTTNLGCKYCINGRLLTLNLDTGLAESNSTSFTATLPITPVGNNYYSGIYKDNGVWSSHPGSVYVKDGSTTITFYTQVFGLWTNSGNKEFLATLLVWI